MTVDFERSSIFSQNNFPTSDSIQTATLKALVDKDTTKDIKNTNKLINAIPIVDSFIAGAGKSSLASATGSFLGRLTSWGVALSGFHLISKGIDKVTSKSDNLQKMQEEHPFVKTIVDIAAMLTLYNVGSNIIAKGLHKIPNDIVQKGLNKISKTMDRVDSSVIAKKVYNPIKKATNNFLANHTGVKNTLKNVTPYIIPAMILGAFAKTTIFNPKRLENRIEENLNC